MNLFETGLSFLEGLALIASPCILPVLPLVLSASIEGGRKRPFGIIIGFVIAFTAFALLSRKLVMVLGINLDIIKYGSLILLAAFGIIMLSETLSAKFSALTQRFAEAGTAGQAEAKDGLLSGIIIGMLIGLVWTPCAGPILAAVLVQVIRQQSDWAAFVQVAAFALGAGMPMLIIALTGRKVLGKFSFLTTHAEIIRKGFGVIILVAVAFIASGIDPQSFFSRQESSKPQTVAVAMLEDGLAQPYNAPEFAGIEGWLNSKPLTMAELKGKVVLIDFWTYSCINCIRTLPYITKWDEEYRDKGLVIIGVSAPEFEFEKNKANVEAALAKFGIHYPVALDNNLDTWSAFNNRYWPAHYLIDKEGKVVYTHFGEGNYAETENNIRYLLGLGSMAGNAPEVSHVGEGQTPETYLGYSRGERFGGEVMQDKAHDYSLPASLGHDQWGLGGSWKVEGQRIVAQKEGSALQFNFTAKKVFLVLGTATGAPVGATITLNGKPPGDAVGQDAPQGMVTVKQHALYELINQSDVKNGLLEIKASPGLEAYAFTFGS